MKNCHLKRFTLIELMLVIAIIAILMSFLLPGLGRARKKAQEASCLSTQKQLYIPLISFAQENKYFAPRLDIDKIHKGEI